MGKFSFVVGFGAGYIVGTRAGRQQFEKIRSAGQQVWQNPRVQSSVHRVEEKVTQAAKDQAAAVTDKVAETVKSRINGNGSGNGHGQAQGQDQGSDTDNAPRPTPPQPEV